LTPILSWEGIYADYHCAAVGVAVDMEIKGRFFAFFIKHRGQAKGRSSVKAAAVIQIVF